MPPSTTCRDGTSPAGRDYALRERDVHVTPRVAGHRDPESSRHAVRVRHVAATVLCSHSPEMRKAPPQGRGLRRSPRCPDTDLNRQGRDSLSQEPRSSSAQSAVPKVPSWRICLDFACGMGASGLRPDSARRPSTRFSWATRQGLRPGAIWRSHPTRTI